MPISIIIPTLNEASTIGSLLAYLNERCVEQPEIIIVDGGSTDDTLQIIEAYDIQLVQSAVSRRSVQLNIGAEHASHDILYFLHADSFPPKRFDSIIREAVEGGIEVGCFRLQFDDFHWFLRLSAWFTRFSCSFLRGGDQSLFITKKCFQQYEGYTNTLLVMEDIEIIRRVRAHTPFKVLSQSVVTSARKYKRNGVFRLQFIFFIIHLMYTFSCSQEQIKKFYQKNIH
ncbi:MAG: TIGR04283 family arsenosugar biosynthesis glycosyltransferase [Cyclobacteriaceae bacterium]